ncbi:MAG: hypothetical protein H5T59_01160 [Anaerolineae bacterium]|nr:hypothetical protein [Anaerolineae bacterium]
MSGKVKVFGIVALVALLVAAFGVTTAFAWGPRAGASGPAAGPALGPMGWGGRGGGFGPRGFGGTPLIGVVAEELDMSVTDLVAELEAGKTLAEVAQEKGVALDTLVEAVVAPRAEALQQAVEEGRITQEWADLMLDHMRETVEYQLTHPVDTPALLGWRAGYGFQLSAIAEELGMTTDELVAELQDGKTVAQIAEEKGVDLESLVDLVLNNMRDMVRYRLSNPWNGGRGFWGGRGMRGGMWGGCGGFWGGAAPSTTPTPSGATTL